VPLTCGRKVSEKWRKACAPVRAMTDLGPQAALREAQRLTRCGHRQFVIGSESEW
jgi:hypothetical protein